MVPERSVRDGATAIADWDNAHDCVDVVLGGDVVGQENYYGGSKSRELKVSAYRCQMGGEDLYMGSVLCSKHPGLRKNEFCLFVLQRLLGVLPLDRRMKSDCRFSGISHPN
jgi:hypothetical protein